MYESIITGLLGLITGLTLGKKGVGYVALILFYLLLSGQMKI